MSPHLEVRSKLKYPRRLRRMAAALTAFAAAVALAAPVVAAPLDRGTYHFEDTFTDPDFCGAGLEVQIEIVVDGRFMFNQRGRTAAFNSQEHRHETFTNVANGRWIYDDFRVLANDIRVTDNGDGTITVLTMATGPFTLYDSAGKPIARNSGQIRDRLLLDYNGTLLDPSDDVLLDVERVKESTGTNDDFCEAALAALT
jgi:hypothetical protein